MLGNLKVNGFPIFLCLAIFFKFTFEIFSYGCDNKFLFLVINLMLYIFSSIFVSHLAALVVMTFLKLDESRLRSALLLTGEFLLLAF